MTTKPKGSSWSSIDNFNYTCITAYGAIADGATDCHTAIAAALATGLPVFIPSGNFICSPLTVPANAYIFGVGNKSQLQAIAVTAGAVLTVGSGTYLGNFAINGEALSQVSNTCHGVMVANAVCTTLEDITVTNTLGDGIN